MVKKKKKARGVGRPLEGKEKKVSRCIRVEPSKEKKLLRKYKCKKIQAAFNKMVDKENL